MSEMALRRYFIAGDEHFHELPFSEVCMHLGVAGKPMLCRVVGTAGSEMVQLLDEDGAPFSFPILPGEAGLYRDPDGRLFA